MYTSVPSEKLHPDLRNYLQSEFVQHAQLVCLDTHDTYVCMRQGVEIKARGLHKTLKKHYYPRFKYKKRKTLVKKKGSSKKEGIKVGKEIEHFVSGSKTRPSHRFSRQVIKYIIKELGHAFQACEVPVWIEPLQCMTQADILTQDSKGRLWMWELKCGSPNMRAQGQLRGLREVKNSRLNHWELQRHYTSLGLIEQGVPIYKSRVLQVYDQYKSELKQKVVTVKARNPAPWTKTKLPQPNVKKSKKRKRE